MKRALLVSAIVAASFVAWAYGIELTAVQLAAGAALAFKLRGEPRVAVATCGDGGSSKTDFYAALNSAGAYELPLVLGVVNNGWAISVPRSAQTGAQTLAQKGIGDLLALQQAALARP